MIYVPGKTRQELASPAPPGGRHAQMVKIASSLTGQGLSADAIFAQLRGMYGPDVPDREIADVVRWASGKHFTPCTPRFSKRPIECSSRLEHLSPARPASPADPAANIKKFLGDFRADEADLWHESPWRPLEDWRFDSLLFLAGMYHGGELVNIVTDHQPDGKPTGCGTTRTREDWMRYIRDHGTPQSAAGAWVRMNPTDGKGVADTNITACRFALIEFDAVPVDLQLSLLARLPLPINAILTSGGKSVHGWVRVNAKNVESYRQKVGELLALLRPFGVDQANKNPSRLSRLPGAQREIGATGDGAQRLLYLAPDRINSQPIFRGQR
jgi:hypothetical protein